jgi:hypothetical protein
MGDISQSVTQDRTSQEVHIIDYDISEDGCNEMVRDEVGDSVRIFSRLAVALPPITIYDTWLHRPSPSDVPLCPISCTIANVSATTNELVLLDTVQDRLLASGHVSPCGRDSAASSITKSYVQDVQGDISVLYQRAQANG